MTRPKSAGGKRAARKAPAGPRRASGASGGGKGASGGGRKKGAKGGGQRQSYDPELLYPLSGPPRRPKISTWDIESKADGGQLAGFERPFLVGFYDGEDFLAFTDQTSGGDWRSRYYERGGCVDRFMRTALHKAYRGYWSYAHNAGNFDLLHILPWLVTEGRAAGYQLGIVPVGNSGLLCVDVWKSNNKWHKWRFIDSLKLLPMSLDKATKSFGVTRKLGDGSGGKFDLHMHEDDPRWIDYNRTDCVGLYEVIDKAADMVEDVFGGELGATAPATAMKIFRRAFLDEAISRDTHTHGFIRPYYFGGRTELLSMFGKLMHDYDINSSYPAAMLLPMPAGGGVFIGDREPPDDYKERRIGFCRVMVRVPDDIAIPPLPLKAVGGYFPEESNCDGKLVFPTGYLKGTWEWSELQNAIECGCEVLQWFESVWYDAKPFLREFVETLYKYRNKAKCFDCGGKLGCRGGDALEDPFWCRRCAKPGYDKALDAWAKLMANSSYGKFGQRPERVKLYWHSDEDMPEGAMPLIEGDGDCLLWWKMEEDDAAFIMPQVSARVTAIGRVALHKFAMTAASRFINFCERCGSKITCEGVRGSDGKVTLGRVVGGSGPHGDPDSRLQTITPSCRQCGCGGALTVKQCEVFYMDTDSLMTDAHMATTAELGGLKDELPRYSGYLKGSFYAPKMYSLSVDERYGQIDEDTRLAMIQRDKSYVSELKMTARAAAAGGDEGLQSWGLVKAKGLPKKIRTDKLLEQMYAGAQARLLWLSDPNNRDSRGRPKKLPPELEAAGTARFQRLEKMGTLMGLKTQDGQGGYRSAAFSRGPRQVEVTKRMHLMGAKRIIERDGSTRPYSIDMRGRPAAWYEAKVAAQEARKTAAAMRKTAKASGKVRSDEEIIDEALEALPL